VTPKETVSSSPATRFSRLVVGCAANVPTDWYGCKQDSKLFFLAAWLAFFASVPIAFGFAEKQHITKPFGLNQSSINVSTNRVLCEPEVLSGLPGCEQSFVVRLNRHAHPTIVATVGTVKSGKAPTSPCEN
jgi:hypothetical protein